MPDIGLAGVPASNSWQPSDHGLLAWNAPISLTVNSGAPTVAGRLDFVKLRLPVAASVTNILMYANSAGVTLTSGQNFAVLYDSALARVGVTADQTAAWGSTGWKTMALASGPFACAAGVYFVAFWYNGTTAPAWMRTGNVPGAFVNVGLSSPSIMAGSADTGLTTTSPATMGAQSAQGSTYWAALS